jgi:hypothetical protein
MLRTDFNGAGKQEHIQDHTLLHQTHNAQSVVNVVMFGAGQGGNDTDAFEAATRACLDLPDSDPETTVRAWIRPLYIPAGTYHILSEWLIQSVSCPVIYGDGMGLSILQFSGALPAGLHLDGVERALISDITITTTSEGSAEKALWYEWRSGEVARSSTNSRFYNVEIDGRFKVGIQIGGDGGSDQEDQTYWFGCFVRGGSSSDPTWWQSGWRIGSGVFGNNLIHNIYGIGSVNCRYGVHMAAGQSSIFGGILQSNEIDVYLEGVTSWLYINGIRSEKSGSFLRTHGAVTYGSHVTLDSIQYHAQLIEGDGYWIKFTYPGTLNLHNVSCVGGYGKVRADPGSKALTINADGFMANSAVGDAFELLGGAQVNLRGFSVIGQGGVQDSHIHQVTLTP